MKGLLSCFYRSVQSYEIFFENGTLSSQKLTCSTRKSFLGLEDGDLDLVNLLAAPEVVLHILYHRALVVLHGIQGLRRGYASAFQGIGQGSSGAAVEIDVLVAVQDNGPVAVVLVVRVLDLLVHHHGNPGK